jgi:PAS domain S-box-containing protein
MATEPAAFRDSSGGVNLAADGAEADAVAIDHASVLDVVDVPIVVVRGDFTIAGFNSPAAEAFGLLQSDVGRTPHEIRSLRVISRLQEWCSEVTATSLPGRYDFRDRDKSYVVRIAPYKSNGRNIAGTVLTFSNVTAFRASIEQAIYEREYAKAVLNAAGDALIVLSTDLRVQSGNRAFFSMFGVSRDGIQGASLAELEQGAFAGKRVRDGLRALLAGEAQFTPFEIEHAFPVLGPRCLRVDARLCSLPGGATRLILLTLQDITDLKQVEKSLRMEKHRFETLNRVAISLSNDLDVQRIVQKVTDSGTKLSGAKFGAFFYNLTDARGESYTLYALSGAPREAFDKLGLPRNTAVFEPTFRGTGIVRSDDIRADPRYGRNSPHRGMPEGHLPVVSYLAVPVMSHSGEVLGGLFFAHDQPGVFTQEAEDTIAGIAAHAAIAIDNARLFQAEKRLASIVETSQDAILTTSLEGVITSWNSGAERIFGYTSSEMIGQPITVLVPKDRHDEEPAIVQRVSRGEHVDHYETVRQRKDGLRIDVALSVSPIKDQSGTIVGVSKIARDITERKKADEARRLLVDEMKHRVKNSLSTVQAIATQSLRSASESERAAFVARLHALANAHDVLTQENWHRAPLREIVNQALRPFEASRFAISGPYVRIDANKALQLTMALHELATNAVKYGALANATGKVSIDWTVLDEPAGSRVRICWEERGGPPVQQTERKGFGSKLIEVSLEKSEVVFAAEGVSCVLEMSLS